MRDTTIRRMALGALWTTGVMCGCANADPAQVMGVSSPIPETPTIPRASIGVWRAKTLNGAPLPALFRTGTVVDSDVESAARFVFVDSAELTLRKDGHYTQAVFYSEWAGTQRSGPTQALYADIAVDAGRWEYVGATVLQLQSQWLAGRRISGTIVGDVPSSLRLRHGITVGAVEATFEYQR